MTSQLVIRSFPQTPAAFHTEGRRRSFLLTPPRTHNTEECSTFLARPAAPFLEPAALPLPEWELRSAIRSFGTASALDPSTSDALCRSAAHSSAVARPPACARIRKTTKKIFPITGLPCARCVKVHRDLPPTRMWSFGDSFPGPPSKHKSRRESSSTGSTNSRAPLSSHRSHPARRRAQPAGSTQRGSPAWRTNACR